MTASPKPRLTGQTSLCARCRLLFTSTAAFSKHLTGKFDIHAPQYGRACLDEAALRARGWEPDPRNRWRRPAPAGHAWNIQPEETDE